MRKIIFQLLISLISLVPFASAQNLDSLNKIKSESAHIYFSPGHQKRATKISKQFERAMSYYQKLLGFHPAVSLLVLNNADWNKYSTMGAVYGMPHYNSLTKTLFVAAEDNIFWKSFLPPLDRLPEGLREQITSVYKNSEGQLSMEAFFDLLVIHELGHAFHFQNNLTMQRKWMGELFVNILLHTYIAEKEPGLLPALTLFPKMVVAGGTGDLKFTSLQDIEECYEEISRNYPKNYGWYQCRWHAAAAKIYEAAGKDIGKKLWLALLNKKEILTDQQLASFFKIYADTTVANVIEKWHLGY